MKKSSGELPRRFCLVCLGVNVTQNLLFYDRYGGRAGSKTQAVEDREKAR